MKVEESEVGWDVGVCDAREDSEIGFLLNLQVFLRKNR